MEDYSLEFWIRIAVAVVFSYLVLNLVIICQAVVIRRLRKREEEWKLIAQIAGVLQLCELPDGEYHIVRSLSKTSRGGVYEIRKALSCLDFGPDFRFGPMLTMYLPGTRPNPVFNVKGGKIHQMNIAEEAVRDWREEAAGQAGASRK